MYFYSVLSCFFVFGFGTYDTYNLFKSDSGSLTIGEYCTSVFLIIMFLLNLISIILIFLKSFKSIVVLNVFYGFLIVLLIISIFVRQFDGEEKDITFTDHLIVIGIICIVSSLIFIINKFKSKKIQYDNIEFIGKHID